MRWPGGKPRRVVLAVVLLLVVAAVECRLFVFPPTDTASVTDTASSATAPPADAVVVLGGPGERIARGWELARAGVAPAVVVFLGDPERCEPLEEHPEEICRTPDPPTTRGEARQIAALARERGWEHIVVVTSASQSVRARMRIERCYDGRVDVVTVREDGLARQVYRVGYENGAMLKALLWERDC